MKIRLGDLVKDKVTGFKGIAVCITTWLNGCDRVGVQPQKLGKDGALATIEYVDSMQLETIKSTDLSVGQSHDTGGPRPNPRRAADPKPR